MDRSDDEWKRFENLAVVTFDDLAVLTQHELDKVTLSLTQKTLHDAVLNEATKTALKEFGVKYNCTIGDIRSSAHSSFGGTRGIRFDAAFIFFDAETKEFHNWIHYRITANGYEFRVGCDDLYFVSEYIPLQTLSYYKKVNRSTSSIDLIKEAMTLSSEHLTTHKVVPDDKTDQYTVLKHHVEDILDHTPDNYEYLRYLHADSRFDTTLRKAAFAIESLSKGSLIRDLRIESVQDKFIASGEFQESLGEMVAFNATNNNTGVTFEWQDDDWYTFFGVYVPFSSDVINVAKVDLKTKTGDGFEIIVPSSLV